MGTYLDSSDDEDYVIELEKEERTVAEQFVNDEEGLQEKLLEFSWGQDLSFGVAQEITSDAPIHVHDVDDDLERELSFYQQAAEAAKTAMRRFEAEGVDWQRPEDYYAEMIKSDDHMARIKDQLIYEKKRIALAEERRNRRESRRFAKQVQATRAQEKQSMKKAKAKSIATLRSQRRRLGFGQEFDWDVAIDEAYQAAPKKSRAPRSKPSTVVKSGKRLYKDAKYGRSGGFGPARDRKKNTAESSGDMGQFRNPKGQKRLGKRRRLAQISRKKAKN